MFKWVHWWLTGRKAKKAIKKQIANSKARGNYPPPTPEQVKAFKKEWDLGWDSHMVQKVESKRTYYEANLN